MNTHTQSMKRSSPVAYSMVLRLIVVLGVLLGLLVLTRPLASEWPAAVVRMRRKERFGAGTLGAALGPAKEAWGEARWQGLAELAAARCSFRHRSWPEERLWAYDLGLVTLGCTHKKCLLGILGRWNALPGPAVDLWALTGLHGVSCLVMHQLGPEVFYSHFAPRMSEPHTLLLGGFASPSPFEVLWLGGTLLGLGPDLQRAIGRGGFLVLWLGGALCSSLLAASRRRSGTGAGGALASFAYHVLSAPNARHNIFGIELGAKAALAAHLGIATWPSVGGQLLTGVALNGLPVVFGSAMWWWLHS